MSRVTHEAEVEFGLDPSDDQSAMTIRMRAEKTASAYPPSFNHVTGDGDPGGPDEFDILSVEFWDYLSQEYREMMPTAWERMFGPRSWDTLLEFLEGELEEV